MKFYLCIAALLVGLAVLVPFSSADATEGNPRVHTAKVVEGALTDEINFRYIDIELGDCFLQASNTGSIENWYCWEGDDDCDIRYKKPNGVWVTLPYECLSAVWLELNTGSSPYLGTVTVD